jgi:PAS domain S-box-containing protein
MLVRDWVKSKEGIAAPRRNRLVLNLALTTLFLMMLFMALFASYSMFKSDSRLQQAANLNNEYFKSQAALFSLDEALQNGMILMEFERAAKSEDIQLLDTLRGQLIKARHSLFSNSLRGFPKPVITEIGRLLNYYMSYQFGPTGFSLISLNSQADSRLLIENLLKLRTHKDEWALKLNQGAVNQRQQWASKVTGVAMLTLFGFIPLFAGIITSRRYARERHQLINTREYFNRLLDALPGVVLLTDHKGDIISASAAVTPFLSLQPGWFEGQNVDMILPKRFRQQYTLYSQNYLERKIATVKGRELLVVDAKGQEIPVELHFGHFDTAEGDVLVLSLRNVTAQRQLYQRFQHAQKRFDMAMTASHDGLWDWDLKTGNVYFSPAWLNMLGVRGGQPLNGITVFESSVYEEDRDRVFAEAKAFVKGREMVFRSEHRLQHTNGSIIDIISRGSVQRDASGRVLRMVGVHSNISDLKDAERGVQSLNRSLEDRVRLRTQQLGNALVSAEAANAAKSAFLSVMGHEIRTPMNGVIGMADLLAKSKLDREQAMMVNTVRRSSLSLLKTLDHILDYATLESGGVKIETQSVRLIEFLEGIVDEFGPQLAKNKQQFILHIDPNIPLEVHIDALQLGKALANLLENALKFSGYTSPQGVIQCRVALSEDQHGVLPEQRRLQIQVIDNGIGIASQLRAHLFEPFVQAESSPSRRFGGLGLGLAISSRLLALMGGDVTLTSTSNEGTCFTVSLLVTIAEGGSDMPEAASKRTVLAGISAGFQRDALAAALNLYTYQVLWFDGAGQLSDLVEGLQSSPFVVISGLEDRAIKSLCDEQAWPQVSLSERPRGPVHAIVDAVYVNPLLPSTLVRAIERKLREPDAFASKKIFN